MFGIRWIIYYFLLFILEQEITVNAFLVPRSVRHVLNQSVLRHPTKSIQVSTPAFTQRQSRLVAPLQQQMATGGPNGSLDKVWAVLSTLLLPLRELVSLVMSLAMYNQWQINLIKHVLTLISIRFVVSTIIDYKRNKPTFQWKNLPRYLLAAGLIGMGAIWIDSIFVIPYYGINIIKNAATLWGIAKTISFIRSRQRKSKSTTKLVQTTVIIPNDLSSKTKTIPSQSSLLEEMEQRVDIGFEGKQDEKDDKVESKPVQILVKEEKLVVDKQDTVEVARVGVADNNNDDNDNDKEPEEKEERNKDDILFEDALKDWVYSLANIQDELAEIQLKRIPDLFSKETYEKTQERITKFQMKKLMDFFGEDENDEK